MPVLHITLLGDFRLDLDDTPATVVNTPRLQSLLAFLLLHRAASQSRQHVAFLLWPDSTEAQARTNLRKHLHHLRRALPNPDRFLLSDTQTLGWRPDASFTLDVVEFESALSQAERAADPVARRALSEQAVALYKGDLLPSCYDDWILPERERLRQAFNHALETLIASLEDQRAYPAAIQNARRLLRHDPLHEATYRRLMRLHTLNGDRAAALRAYHTCATVLARELDVEPGAATQDAYERLLQIEAPPAPYPAWLVPALPLVGRDREWGALQAAWRKAAGKPHLALLSGEPGIGKTRLAEELLSWAARQGIPTASVHCYAGGGQLAYTPVTAWLRADPLRGALSALDPVWLTEVARLLPELLVERPALSRPVPLVESWQRRRLFEALARALLTRRQLILLLDDLQWCDGETLDWLPFLLRAPTSTQLLLVATLRAQERPDDDQLTTLLGDLRRDEQLIEIEPGTLNETQVAALAEKVSSQTLDARLTTRLAHETEGNPLFVVEMVQAGLPGPEGEWPLPPTVQQAIAARLARLSPRRASWWVWPLPSGASSPLTCWPRPAPPTQKRWCAVWTSCGGGASCGSRGQKGTISATTRSAR